MAASFPSSIKTFTAKVDNVDSVQAVHINDLQAEVEAIETELGITSAPQKMTADGWMPSTSTWSYSSVDSPTGVISVNADMTSKIQKGMRIKYNQGQALTYYWTFDTNNAGSVGSPTMTNRGTPTYSAGKFSNALTLNGTDQALTVTDAANLKPTGEFTIGLWYKSDGTGIVQSLFQSYSDNTNANGIRLEVTTGNVLTFRVGNNSASDSSTLTGAKVVADGGYHYIVVASRNNYTQIYVDGVLDVAGYTVTPTYSTNYVEIGVRNVAGSAVAATWCKGQIDDLYLINGYALDEETIRTKYLAGAAQGTGNITITKKAIVTNVGAWSGSATLITAYHGTDHTLVNATISSPYYSSVKVPFGLNVNPDKWTVLYVNQIDFVVSSPAALAVFDMGIAPVCPIGSWESETHAILQTSLSPVSVQALVTLTCELVFNALTLESSSGKASIASPFPISTAGILRINYLAFRSIALEAKATMYLIALQNNTSAAIANSISLMGASVAPTIVKFKSAYL